MWVCIRRCDDDKRIIYGTLDNEPVNNEGVRLGSELAASYDKHSGAQEGFLVRDELKRYLCPSSPFFLARSSKVVQPSLYP